MYRQILVWKVFTSVINCQIFNNNYSMSGRSVWNGRYPMRCVAPSWLYSSHIQQVYYFIKNAPKISRILPNFICKNNWFSACFWLWADLYSYHMWRAWYNGSYTMMAKPILAPKLHCQMIQFLIITNIINFYTFKYIFLAYNQVPQSLQGSEEGSSCP